MRDIESTESFKRRINEVKIEVAERFLNYVTDWDYEYYLLVGGYGSGKSYNTALKIVLKLLEEKRTCLVVREVFETIRESCYKLFESILEKLDLLSIHNGRRRAKGDKKVVGVVSPMEFRFPNGSRIIFKGLDSNEKVKSVHGVSIVWIEECSEIRYSAFQELLGRVRENNVTLHFILTCNPIGKENWVYRHFFERLDNEGNATTICDEEKLYKRGTIVCRVDETQLVYYHHSICNDNPFLPSSYISRLDALKNIDKHLWLVARWGRFGATGERVLPNFVVAKNAKKFRNKIHSISSQYHFFGLDFGFETSFNALVSCAVDDKTKTLFIYDEVYVNKITDDRFIQREDVERVRKKAESCDKAICADNAEPKTIQYYRQNGFNIYGCKKYVGSRLQNTKKMKRFRKIVCSPRCKNAIRELQYLTYKKDSKGNVIYDEFTIDPHLFSALWYALDNYTVADIKEEYNTVA